MVGKGPRAAGGLAPLAAGSGSTNPADLTVVELLPLLESRRLSAREPVEACIARVERFDVKAFERPTFDLALAGARAADEARAAGMVLLAKPSGTEFAYGTNSPPTVNPWDTGRSPGGSSGGSGAGLAARSAARRRRRTC